MSLQLMKHVRSWIIQFLRFGFFPAYSVVAMAATVAAKLQRQGIKCQLLSVQATSISLFLLLPASLGCWWGLTASECPGRVYSFTIFSFRWLVKVCVCPLSLLPVSLSGSAVELVPLSPAISRTQNMLPTKRSTSFLTEEDNKKYRTGSRQLLRAENSKATSLALSATLCHKHDVSVIWVFM